jgi:hypothetical protein
MDKIIEEIYDEWITKLENDYKPSNYIYPDIVLYHTRIKKEVISSELNFLASTIEETDSKIYPKVKQAFFDFFKLASTGDFLLTYQENRSRPLGSSFISPALKDLNNVFNTLHDFKQHCENEAKQDVDTAIHAVSRLLFDLTYYDVPKTITAKSAFHKTYKTKKTYKKCISSFEEPIKVTTETEHLPTIWCFRNQPLYKDLSTYVCTKEYEQTEKKEPKEQFMQKCMQKNKHLYTTDDNQLVVRRSSSNKLFNYEKKHCKPQLTKENIYSLIAYNLKDIINTIYNHTGQRYIDKPSCYKDEIDTISKTFFNFKASSNLKSIPEITYLKIELSGLALTFPNLVQRAREDKEFYQKIKDKTIFTATSENAIPSTHYFNLETFNDE